MKKLSIFIAASVAAVAVYLNVNNDSSKDARLDLLLENVDAIAAGEGGIGGEGCYQVYQEYTSGTIYCDGKTMPARVSVSYFCISDDDWYRPNTTTCLEGLTIYQLDCSGTPTIIVYQPVKGRPC